MRTIIMNVICYNVFFYKIYFTLTSDMYSALTVLFVVSDC